MTNFLQRVTGLDKASPLELVKYLATNVGGKIASVIVAVMGTAYLIAPELPERWSAFLGRAQWACISYLLAIIFWRQLRNQKMLTTSIAQATIADPAMADRSSDPAIQREIGVQKAATASGVNFPVQGEKG